MCKILNEFNNFDIYLNKTLTDRMIMKRIDIVNMKLLSELENKFTNFDERLTTVKAHINQKFEKLGQRLAVEVQDEIKTAAYRITSDVRYHLEELIQRLDSYESNINIFVLKFIRNKCCEATGFDPFMHILNRLLKQVKSF